MGGERGKGETERGGRGKEESGDVKERQRGEGKTEKDGRKYNERRDIEGKERR